MARTSPAQPRRLRLDPLGEQFRQRLLEAMAARPHVSRQMVCRAIGRGPSWLSQVLTGTRAVNDLRVVVRLARFFDVPIGWLLAEPALSPDADAAMLLAVYDQLSSRDRKTVLHLAIDLAARPPGAAGGDRPSSDREPTAAATT